MISKQVVDTYITANGNVTGMSISLGRLPWDISTGLKYSTPTLQARGHASKRREIG